MQKVKLDSLLQYRALSDLSFSPNGVRAAYLVHSVSDNQRNYETRLVLYGTKNPCAETNVLAQSFLWRNDDEIFVVLPRDPHDREQHTRIDIYNCNTGALRPAADLPLIRIHLLGIRPDGALLLAGTQDAQRLRRLEGLHGQARQVELERMDDEAARFTVLDEFPYWFNGLGIINGQRNGIYAYFAESGSLQRLTPEGFHVHHAWYSAEDGRMAIAGFESARVRMYKPGLFIMNACGGEWVCLIEKDVCRIDHVVIWNHKILATVSMEELGTSAHTPPRMLWIDWHDGSITEFTAEAPFVGSAVVCDVRLGSGKVIKPRGQWLYFILSEAESANLARIGLDGHIEKITNIYGSVDMFDMRTGEALCVALKDMRLQELYRVHQGRLDCLSAFNTSFCDQHEIVLPEPLFFQNAEGVEIHGFILKPVGYDPTQRYPLILDVHGGPGLAYGTVYMHEMQYWASHGYFVIFANPRGSGARGDAFHDLYGRFGTVDTGDLMRFVDLVLERYPCIDSKRMGITGGSYGGFLTNWIIGHTQRFAAAASQRSICNHITMEGISDMAGFTSGEMVMATPWSDLERVWRASPLCYVDYVTTPTLFIHAEQDYRCPASEALQMYTALAIRGVEVRMCLFKDENHELSRSGKPVNRLRRMEEITRWMDEHLGNQQKCYLTP